MDKVTILVEGYAHPGLNDSYVASPTCSLVESNGKRFIVDPGTNAKALLLALEKNEIEKESLSGIYLSHYHPDHFLNIRLFPDLDIYDGSVQWSADVEYFHKDKIPGTNIEIILTPGHSSEDASLLVTTEEGKICIAPDVFWWEDGQQKTDNLEDLLNLDDPFASDKNALLESRKLVLKLADFIVPGHGNIFKNNFKNL